MSPTTRSDSLKKKVQKRETYSRSAKRSMDNEFEATTSEVQPGLQKVAKVAAKNNNKTVLKSQKRKRFNVGIHTPKITKKPKSGIKIGIGRGKFPREALSVKKARINGTHSDAYGVSMAVLIKEVEDSKREIVNLKTKSEEQELNIKRLEQIIEKSFNKSEPRDEGHAEPSVNEGDSTHFQKAQERETPDNEPTFQGRDEQSRLK